MAQPLQPTLQQVLQSHAALQNRTADMSAASQGAADSNTALRSEGIDLAQVIGSLSMQQAQRENTIAAETEQRKAAVGEAFNADILNPDNQIAYLAQEQAAAVRESNERAKYGQALVDTNIWSDPLAYMLQRPFAHREFNAAAAATQRAQNLDRAIDDLNAQVPATVQAQQAIQQTFTAEDAARKLEFTALTAAEKARQLKLANNQAQLSDLQAVQQIAVKDFDVTVTKYKLIREQEEFNARMEEHRAARKARKDEKIALEEYMGWYNEGAKVLGRKPFVDVEQFAAQLKINKDNITKVAERGGMTYGQVGKNDMIAPSPGAAQVTLESVQGSMPPTAVRTSSYLKHETDFAKQDIQKAGGKLTAESAAQRANVRMVGGEQVSSDGKGKEKVTGSVAVMKQNAEQDLHGGKVQNIYKAPALPVILEVVPQIQELPGFADIVVPASLTTPSRAPTAEAVQKQAQIAVATGKVSIDQAAETVSKYFKAVALTNNTNERYMTVGLPTQESYRALISDPITGSLAPVDMMNDTARIKHNLMRASKWAKPGTLFERAAIALNR